MRQHHPPYCKARGKYTYFVAKYDERRVCSSALAEFSRLLVRSHSNLPLLTHSNLRWFRHADLAYHRLGTLSKPEERKRASTHRLLRQRLSALWATHIH